jgi:hypothetical protein
MKKIFHIILISLFSLTVISCAKEEEKKTEAPVIAEVYPVTTPTSDPSPNYTFSSTKAGTITYGGSCSSGTTTATSGRNTITFVTLSDGTYSDCTIIVTDSDGNASNTLEITSFIVNSTDTTAPTVTSVSPTDNSTDVSVSTAVAVTFSEAISTSTITTNTDNTTCSGSFQLSSNNFATCIQMSAAPSASNSDKTFSSTPADNLSRGTNYKLQITTSAKDTSSNSLADNYTTTNGFTTYGTGTIRGTVRYDNNTAADNVSMSFAKSGTIVDNITNFDNGTYVLDNLSLGRYTLTAAKINYIDATQSATLATDNQTVTANLILLSNTCSAGTVSGTITDAVSGNAVSGVSLSVRSGLNVTSGSTTGTTATTATNGTYTLSSMNAGGYTVQVSKTGYLTSYFNVNVCGNMSNQNIGISEELSSGTMRIVLSWPSGSTADDLDSHLEIPDNASSTFHVYYPSSKKIFYYAKNTYTCSSCSSDQLSDNVTLDRDDSNGAPGTETITITKVRSGTYSYSVLDYDNAGNASSTVLSTSGASVKVYYNNTTTTFNVPNSAGDLWRVFTFTTSGGLIASGNMSSASNSASVY